MNRLTEIYFDEFGIKHARLKDNIAKKTYRSYTFTPQEIANQKLAELEDFMEKHKCHSVGDLMLEFTISAVDKLNLKVTEEKLAEMKAKLAESERSKEINIKERDKICLEMATDYNKQILELKQQLAEKETAVISEMENGETLQNKTAIAELEKVKEEFTSEVLDMYDTPDLLEQICEFRNAQIKYIDQQIKSLKGEGR